MERVRIWVDCDVALGEPWRDPDDAFALAAIARAPGVELLGVSTVFGNTRAARAAEIARHLVALAGRPVEVVTGAERAGETTGAARALAGLAPGTSLVAIGPLTNVAAALALDPGLAARVELRAVGGNRASWGRWPPYWPFEFNLALDPAATDAVFAAPFLRRRLFPLDVACRLRVGPLALARFARRGGALGAALARGSLGWLAYSPLRYRSPRFPLWDLVPALDAAGLLQCSIEQAPLVAAARGRIVPGPLTEWVRGFDADAGRAAFERLLFAR